VERYLADSEQIPSALVCDARISPDGGIDFAAGILVQALPGGEAAAEVEATRALLGGGAFLRALLTLLAHPLDGESVARAALGALAGDLQVLDRRPVEFRCPCSRARAASSLVLLGNSELSAMILEDGKAEVTCNFCRARYDFDDAELELLRRETAKPSGPPS
jgi:molecular chaperone Hsp33